MSAVIAFLLAGAVLPTTAAHAAPAAQPTGVSYRVDAATGGFTVTGTAGPGNLVHATRAEGTDPANLSSPDVDTASALADQDGRFSITIVSSKRAGGIFRLVSQDPDTGLSARAVLSYWTPTLRLGVDFDANGASGSQASLAAYRTHPAWSWPTSHWVRLPEPTGLARTGYDFAGWSIDGVVLQPGQDLSVTFPDQETDAQRTAIAQWNVQSRSASFTAADATAGQAPASLTVDYGTEITFPGGGDLARDGYAFSGWRLGTTVYQPGQQLTLTDDVTFEAEWASASGGGGSGSSGSSSVDGADGNPADGGIATSQGAPSTQGAADRGGANAPAATVDRGADGSTSAAALSVASAGKKPSVHTSLEVTGDEGTPLFAAVGVLALLAGVGIIAANRVMRRRGL